MMCSRNNMACSSRLRGSSRRSATYVLTGLLDRSALYGVLAEIEALGLDLVEVHHLTRHRKSPESGDRRSP